MPTLFCPRTRRVRGHPRATPRKTWDLDRIERRRRGSCAGADCVEQRAHSEYPRRYKDGRRTDSVTKRELHGVPDGDAGQGDGVGSPGRGEVGDERREPRGQGEDGGEAEEQCERDHRTVMHPSRMAAGQRCKVARERSMAVHHGHTDEDQSAGEDEITRPLRSRVEGRRIVGARGLARAVARAALA